MAAKQWKLVSLTDSDVQTFLEAEENWKKKKKPNVSYWVALVMAFLPAEKENQYSN